jgi:hypothetical protein
VSGGWDEDAPVPVSPTPVGAWEEDARPGMADPGALTALGRGLAQGATMGMGERLQAGIQASLPVDGDPTTPGFRGAAANYVGSLLGPVGGLLAKRIDPEGYGQRYQKELASVQRQNDAAAEHQPVATLGGNLIGGLTALPLAAGAGVAESGVSLLPRLWSGAKAAAPLGAIAGASTSRSDTPGGVVWDATKGGLIAGGTGAVLSGVGGAIGDNLTAPERIFLPLRRTMIDTIGDRAPIINVRPSPSGAGIVAAPVAPQVAPKVLSSEYAIGPVTRLITGDVEPTPNASFLRSKGVRITRAQQDPFSPANQQEQALESINPRIMQQRGVGPADLRIAALNEALPPGSKPVPIGTPFDEAIGQVSDAFNRSYGDIGSFPVYPAVHGAGRGPLQGTTKTPGLVEKAVASVARLAPSQRDSITADVLDQIGRLPPRKGAIGQVDAADLIQVRSVIRSRARDYRSDHNAESTAAAEAYEAAEDVVTEALKSQLPTRLGRALDKTDAAYRNFKIVDSAVQAARSSPDGFTSRQLGQAASKGASGTAIGSQNVGPLYDLARAGTDVFRVTSPPTGARVATLQAMGEFLPKPIQNFVLGRAVEGANRTSMEAVPALVDAMRLRPKGLVMDPPGSLPSAPWEVPLGSGQTGGVSPSVLAEAMRIRGYPALLPAGAQDQERSRSGTRGTR